MDRSSIITLQTTTKRQNEYGVWIETETGRDVFCQVDSVSASEFFEGGRSGLNPEFRMTLFAYDYNGEDSLIYKGNPYAIYRTYHGRGDTIELYVERKGGTNGKAQQESQCAQSGVSGQGSAQ